MHRGSGHVEAVPLTSMRQAAAAGYRVITNAAEPDRQGVTPAQGTACAVAARRIVARNTFGDSWRAAVKAAGLPAGTRCHDLRHFYASTLIAAGLHPKVIQERLGHATISETMDTYGYLFPDAAEHGRGAVDAAFGPADVRPMCARQRS